MTLSILIDGVAPPNLTHALAANDRGFHYGDGVFETALLHAGAVRFLDAHLERLKLGCARLGIALPEREQLLNEVRRVTDKLRSGVLKIVISRGATGARGYRPTGELASTRMIALYAAPEMSKRSIQLRWCETRLGRNARLAGIKHCNRLEQVLAQSEWNDANIQEGLMLDTEGELVAGTASNVFVVRDGVVSTPDLRFSGVRGVMRAQVLRAASELGILAREEPLWPEDLQAADEVFVTNAVRGIRSVNSLGTQQWQRSDTAARLTEFLEL